MAEALKHAYDAAYLQRLGEVVAGAAEETAAGPFDAAAFQAAVLAEGWDSLELKGRMARIGACLHEALPPDYRTILRLVKEEGLTMRAAGERMGRSREAAKKLYGRALLRLTEVFRARGGFEHG